MRHKKIRLPSIKYVLFISIFVALISFVFYLNIPKKTYHFQSSLFSNTYTSSTNNLHTSLKVTSEGAQVSISRNDSQINFTTPLTKATVTNKNDQIIYQVPEKNLEIRYLTTSQGLKEDIVLFKIPKVPMFTSTFQTKNLIVKLSPENIPVFYNPKNEYQFHLARPYATDANGVVTYDLKYSLLNKSKNAINNPATSQPDPLINRFTRTLLGQNQKISQTSYTLALEVNEKWLNDPRRKLPIIIDPTVIYDASSEFATGIFNRVVDVGSSGLVALGTGGTITFDGNYVVHTFLGGGTFVPNGAINVEVLVVAGGGGGSASTLGGGGGGAGGILYHSSIAVSSPTNIIVGAGGTNVASGGVGNPGGDSYFGISRAIGGGGGMRGTGGNGGGDGPSGLTGSYGVTNQTSNNGGIGYGNNGGYTTPAYASCGGGGGAGGVGGNGTVSTTGAGGPGLAFSISGTNTYYGGGGGSSDINSTKSAGGIGGGGGGGGAILVNDPTERTSSPSEYTFFPITSSAIAQLGKVATFYADIKTPINGLISFYALGKYEIGAYTQWNSTPTYQRIKMTGAFSYNPSGQNGEVCNLSFYGGYGSGIIPTVRNIKVELGNLDGVNGTGGGGGGNTGDASGAGGSGIVIIRYPAGYANNAPGLTTGYQELSPDQNTVALWHMNETAGTGVTDSSGNNNNGTATGTTIDIGKFGNARRFNGTSDYISVPDSNSLDLANNYTIEGWINIDTINPDRRIISKGNWVGGNNNSYELYYVATSSLRFRYSTNGTTNPGGEATITSSYINPNTWHHFAVTRDNTTLKIYIDGVLDTTNGGGTSTTTFAGTAPLVIGKLDNNSQYFTGKLDEIRISNNTRSPEEIRLDASRRPYSVYTSPIIDLTVTPVSWNSLDWTETGVATGDGETLVNTTGLVAQWNFNETSGTTASVAAGSCGSNCNGTLTNFANTSGQDIGTTAAPSGWTVNNKRWGAGALMFDGVNDYVNVTNPIITNNTTVTMWFQNPVPSQNYPGLIQNGVNTISYYGHILGPIYGAQQGNIVMFFYNNSGTRYDLYSQHPLSYNTWHYLVAIFDSTANTTSLYIDGILQTSLPTTGTLRTPSGALRIGTLQGTTSEFFNGIIDSTAIYSRALTANEILSNYNAGNIEFQTRTSADGSTWDNWLTTSNETAIDTMDSVYQYNTSDTGLIAYWPMDELSGNSVADIKSSNTATATGTTTVDGKWGKARGFNGTSDYLTAPLTALPTSTNTITVEYWAIISRQVANQQAIQSTPDDGTNRLNIHADWSGNIYWDFGNISTGGRLTTPFLDSWHDVWAHWVFVSENGVGMKIYRNGALIASNATTSTFTKGTKSLYIGRDSTTYFFSGSIDEFRIYNTALPASTIQQHFLEGSSNPSLVKPSVDTNIKMEGSGSERLSIGTLQVDSNTVGLWHLDETSGTGDYLKDSIQQNAVAGIGTSSSNPGISCMDILVKSPTRPGNGIYWIDPDGPGGSASFQVYCDMTTSGGGWTNINYNFGSINAITGPYLNAGQNSTTVINTGSFSVSNTTCAELAPPNDYKRHYFTAALKNLMAFDQVLITASTQGTGNISCGGVGAGGTQVALVSGTQNHVGRCDGNVGGGECPSLTGFSSQCTAADVTIIQTAVPAATPITAFWAACSTGGANYVLKGVFVRDSASVASIPHHGTPTGTTVVDGFSGKARKFNGTSDYINANLGTYFGNNNPLSTEAWVYVTPTTNGPIFGLTTVPPGGGWNMPFLSINGTTVYGWIYGDATLSYTTSSGWHYLALTYDPSNGGTEKFYVDGTLVASGTGQYTPSGSADYWSTYISGVKPTGVNSYLNGTIDEVRASSVTRTPEEIAEAYRAGANYHISKTIVSTDLSGKNKIPFYVASDRLGTFLETIIGKSPFANYEPDTNTVGLWHLEEQSLTASGGTVTTSGGYTYHTFTSNGTFTPKISGAVEIYAWGGGGAGGTVGGWVYGAAGGAGGAANGSVRVTTNSSYVVTVGGGGGVNSYNGGALTCVSGGGACASWNNSDNRYGSGGGGYSGIFLTSETQANALLIAGGGGGGGSSRAGTGNAGGGGGGTNGQTGSSPYDGKSAYGGNPGTQSAAGADASCDSPNTTGGQTALQGGRSKINSYGGAGGGGYWGGSGGGYSESNTMGGGGGGSAYYNPTYISSATLTAASGTTPGDSGNSLRGTAGNVGAVASAGTAGVVIIRYPSPIAKDSSGYSNNGIINGTSQTQGRIGKARSFGGNSDSIYIPGTLIAANGDLTMSGWFNSNSWSTSTCGPNQLFANTNFIFGNDNGVNFNFGFKDTGVVWREWAATPLPSTGQWHYAAGTRQNNYLKLYMDGKLVSQTATNLGNAALNSFYLGGSHCSTIGFNGTLDELRVDNVARTPAEILQAYEIGRRSYPITIDFKAKLYTNNIIVDSSDLYFAINETSLASDTPAGTLTNSRLYIGDKVIVKENVNGIEYIAQGTVNSAPTINGNTTVSAWDSGSSFPVGGFTVNATVFKWQREYFDISNIPADQRNAITNLSLRVTDGALGANVWLDDFKSSSNYLTNNLGSTIPSTLNRYFQYRALISSSDLNVSPSLNSVTIDYTTNASPTTPTLILPTNSVTNQSVTPTFNTVTTDPESDPLQYELKICTNNTMTTGCQTFDQTVSQLGWSGQNIGTSAYSSGTSAVYNLQIGNSLAESSTYYWKSRAIDPTGGGLWSSTQTTPFSFTTGSRPSIPTLDSPGIGATNVTFYPNFKTTATDINGDYLRYQIKICTDQTMTLNCQSSNQTISQVGWSGQNMNVGTSAYTSGSQASYLPQPPLTANTSYYWQTQAIDPGGLNRWSLIQAVPSSFTTGSVATPTTCVVDQTSFPSFYLVKWTDSATDETGYEVYRQVNGIGGFNLLNITAANVSQYTDTPVSVGNTYQYRIRAKKTVTGGDLFSDYCTTPINPLSPGIGNFRFQGLRMQGLQIK